MSAIQPANAALLLMDFQNVIIGMMGDAGPPVLARAREAGTIARKAGVAVMHVRVAFTDADYAALPPRNKAFAAMASRRFLTDGTDAAAIHDGLGAQPDEPVFTKRRVGAFSTTGLGMALAARGIDTLFLAGLSTSGVVLSTLRDAADKDFRLFVLQDCCGDPDPEVHHVLMSKVFVRQADIIALEAFRELWR